MKIGIIGCGNMGGAVARGILGRKVLSFNNIFISDKESCKTRELCKKFGMHASTNEEIVKKCDFIIIAVKPQDSAKLLTAISGILKQPKHLISIMAGVTIARIETLLNKKIAITRAMPNMAALVGKSVTAISHNGSVRNKAIVQTIFLSIGDVVEINEKYMDVVTAIRGSGHAYFYYLTEALRGAAIKLGLNEKLAAKLANATLVGSGALLEGLGHSPEALRKSITSKKGTTEAALNVLKRKKFEEIVAEAVREAAKRSLELSSLREG